MLAARPHDRRPRPPAKTTTTYHARNPFPVGGVVEDPATGAAAAAFGAYLREIANTHRHGHDPPGRRHGPPEPAHRRDRPDGAAGIKRQRSRRGDVSERYCAWASVSVSMPTSSAASFNAATSRSISSGTGCTPGVHEPAHQRLDRQRLQREGHVHDRRRMPLGGGEVHHAPAGDQVQRADRRTRSARPAAGSASRPRTPSAGHPARSRRRTAPRWPAPRRPSCGRSARRAARRARP